MHQELQFEMHQAKKLLVLYKLQVNLGLWGGGEGILDGGNFENQVIELAKENEHVNCTYSL